MLPQDFNPPYNPPAAQSLPTPAYNPSPAPEAATIVHAPPTLYVGGRAVALLRELGDGRAKVIDKQTDAVSTVNMRDLSTEPAAVEAPPTTLAEELEALSEQAPATAAFLKKLAAFYDKFGA